MNPPPHTYTCGLANLGLLCAVLGLIHTRSNTRRATPRNGSCPICAVMLHGCSVHSPVATKGFAPPNLCVALHPVWMPHPHWTRREKRSKLGCINPIVATVLYTLHTKQHVMQCHTHKWDRIHFFASRLACCFQCGWGLSKHYAYYLSNKQENCRFLSGASWLPLLVMAPIFSCFSTSTFWTSSIGLKTFLGWSRILDVKHHVTIETVHISRQQ